MKSFFDEFKKFILRGNVMDMAVGVIVGAAFQAIVTSLVNDIISPIIGLIANTDMSYLVWTVGDVEIRYGAFITAIINFIIMAFVIFTIVRTINKVADSHKKPEAPVAPTTKVCPYCKSEIAIDATKCPHCTSELEK